MFGLKINLLSGLLMFDLQRIQLKTYIEGQPVELLWNLYINSNRDYSDNGFNYAKRQMFTPLIDEIHQNEIFYKR